MKRVIIAIGGSGQMVLHHYAQLYLLGVVKEPFQAFVLDADRQMNSLKLLSGFFSEVRKTVSSATKDNVPSIEFIQLAPSGQGGKVKELLVNGTLSGEPGWHHPVQAFFSRDFLEQDVREGLYARPGLSTVTTVQAAFKRIQPQAFEDGTKVALTGSCIGGTGGGLSIPILWHVQAEAGAKVSQRVVLLGDYFQSQVKEQKLKNQIERFHSNRTMFLKALMESVPDLKAYAFVEEPRMPERHSEEESESRRLGWAEQNLPYWKAASALDYLLVETVQDVKEFGEREVQQERFVGQLNRSRSVERLETCLGRLESMLRHNVLRSLARESSPQWIWGKSLVGSLLSFAQVHRSSSTAAYPKPSGFIPEVGRWMDKWWREGLGESYGLREVFPSTAARAPRLDELRTIDWPRASDELTLTNYASREDAARLCAASMMFAVLRAERAG